MIVNSSVKEEIINARKNINNLKAFVGFDGFIDKIVSPIDKRDYENNSIKLINTITDFSERIKSAAGKSANIELLEKIDKLGGNGPIMANAQLALGVNVKYIGALGYPNINRIFSDFAQKTNAISISNPGITHAIEFNDGKIMLGTMKSLESLTFDRICDSAGKDKLIEIFNESDSISIINWTMIPELTNILNKILTEIMPKIIGKKNFFFDLSDPEKRTNKDIEELLSLLCSFNNYGKTSLGLNLRESIQVAEVLNIDKAEDNRLNAKTIREKLNLDNVVIHPTNSAFLSTVNGVFKVDGPYCEKPKITTGGGDHFNAGFITAKLLGLSEEACLIMAVATSGFYVRNAASPSFDDLISFIKKY